MQITDIKVRKVSQEGKMKAVVSVTFDDVFVVHDIKVIEGKEKLHVLQEVGFQLLANLLQESLIKSIVSKHCH